MSERQVVLLNHSESASELITQTLAPLSREFPSLRALRLPTWAIATELNPRAELVIMDAGRWTAAETNAFFELRKIGYRGPILVVSSTTLSRAKLADAIPVRSQDLLFIEAPYAALELQALVCRVLRGRSSSHRADRRFPVEIPVQIELQAWDREAVHLTTEMVDLSQSGTFLSVSAQVMMSANVRVGERCRLNFELKESRSAFRVEGRVVRTEPGGFAVEFTKDPVASGEMQLAA